MKIETAGHRRTVLGFILLAMLVIYASTAPTRFAQVNESVLEAFDYEKQIKDFYKRAEAIGGVSAKTWRDGLLAEYGLILDRVENAYKMQAEQDTTDGRHLVCGVLTITGFCKTKDGMKKRVVKARQVCHVFKDKKVEKALKISEIPTKFLNGWDDLIVI